MKTRQLLMTISLLLIMGCQSDPNQEQTNIASEINAIKTDEDKRKFLEKILEDDQNVRDGKQEAELMLKYGKDSKEHMEYNKAQWKQDEINLLKVDAYLEKFGYPKKKTLGNDAAMAPWLVIHHATDIGLRNSYFELLYKAYLEGDLDDTQMSMYLGRTHEFTFRERFDMESPFQPEDEINQLIERLDLTERKAKIQ